MLPDRATIRTFVHRLALPSLLAAGAAISTPAVALQPIASIAKVATGGYHTCALATGGGVKCWGDNFHGQLGDNSTTRRGTPMNVVGLASGAAAIAAGESHSCALTTNGGVKCWGMNDSGQLGDNSTTERLTPVDVSGLASGVASIEAGARHTCALTTGGAVKCWGSNFWGQLGDNSTIYRFTPVDVAGLSSGVAAIAAGSAHTCALTTGGGVKCWGAGALGDGVVATRLAPVDVVGLASGVTAIAAGDTHSCALTAGGGVKCWGQNIHGELGDGSVTTRLTPVDVTGLASGIAAIAAGLWHTCALTTDGAVKCWGANTNGQLGNNSSANRLTPVDVPGLASGVAAIAAGFEHNCALTTGGGLKCWGYNLSGQLGDGFTRNRLIPVDVQGIASGVAAIAAGGMHTCALTTDGGVKCWGRNLYGELGDNSTTMRPIPVDVLGLASGVAAIAAGYGHNCALTTGGGVKCWGYNLHGQIGDNSTTDRLVPVDVPGLANGVAAIATGMWHTCALTTGGAVKCWGQNLMGQLGDNSTTDSHAPVDVAGLGSGVAAIAAGQWHTCALTTDGAVKCWGSNQVGQLGDNSTTSRLTPADVSGLANGVAAVAAGIGHTCALTTGGGVKCWGWNFDGQLGNGFTMDRWTPVDVSGLASGATAVEAGMMHNCALTAGGGVKCWGDNYSGQLGDNSTTDRLAPVDVSGIPSGATAVAAGWMHTCALVAGGGAKCWGENVDGQLGDGTAAVRPLPADVLVDTATLSVALVVTGHGSGSVSSSPAGIDCAFSCSADFDTGSAVTLTAAPGPSSAFLGWSGACTGTGTCQVTVDVAKSVTATFTWIPWGPVNVSTRGKVGTGDNVMIGGFIIEGSAPKTVLVTARGPSLAAFGVMGALPNPTLQLASGQTLLASNDDWGTAPNAPDIQASGNAPSDAFESAILATLDPGAYTAIVSGVGGTSGVGIVEVFERDRTDVPLVNLSTRGQVLTGDDVLIGGFIIQGDAPRRVLVRARGPSMIPFGVTNALANPRLQLFSGQTQVASSDDWSSQVDAAAITATGLAPTSAVESAILITLMPGAYTAIVSGVGGGTGVGIVEVFAR